MHVLVEEIWPTLSWFRRLDKSVLDVRTRKLLTLCLIVATGTNVLAAP
jgi:hypothetical protein